MMIIMIPLPLPLLHPKPPKPIQIPPLLWFYNLYTLVYCMIGNGIWLQKK